VSKTPIPASGGSFEVVKGKLVQREGTIPPGHPDHPDQVAKRERRAARKSPAPAAPVKES
jgi:hypothetical protein